MGCDIHCHVEVKINGTWHHWSAPDVNRSYELFARMAGVRAYTESPPPIVEPRGFVPDPTIITEMDYHDDGSDAHTPSWLTGEEVHALLCEWADRYPKMPQGNRALFGVEPFKVSWQTRSHPEWFPDGVEDARLVFWFDN